MGLEGKSEKTGEPFLTTDTKHSNFQLIKRLYQPNMRRGIIFSILLHLFAIWMIYIFASSKDNDKELQQQQRIVVVEDLEKPKFEPPDIDKPKEIEKTSISDNGEVRPVIKPKPIIPKINRPKNDTRDSSEIAKKNAMDSIKARNDSLLALSKKDTSRLVIPDSLRVHLSNNELGLHLDVPPNSHWGIMNHATFGLPLEQFKGEILGLDSTSEDFKGASLIIQNDDPNHTVFNKTAYKNTFDMDDSSGTISAYNTDPQTGGLGKITYKFFIFFDKTGNNNLYVNIEVKNKDMFDKYKKQIEFIIRSIRLVPKSSNSDGNKK